MSLIIDIDKKKEENNSRIEEIESLIPVLRRQLKELVAELSYLKTVNNFITEEKLEEVK